MPASFAPLQPSNVVLGDEVYARLSEAILDGTLAPGERLRDHELAERLGVSRTPVREALQRLERAGLVEVAPNRYTRVSIPNEKSRADVAELVAYNMGFAVRLAAQRCTDEQLAAALERLDEVIAVSRTDDHAALAQASHRFFLDLTQASDNTALIDFINEYEISLRRNLDGWRPFVACPIGRTAAYEEFREAFAQRDGERAEQLLRGLNGFA